jgi:F1F0 ATPase subunit 2
MNELVFKSLVFVSGMALGTVFFGGLWLTVKKTLSAKHPAVWYFGSLLVRVGITLAGFYYVASGSWVDMLICLLGFIISRFVILNATKKTEAGEFK